MNNEEKKNIEIVKFDNTPYTDAISRQAAISAMREETCGCCWDAKDILKHLPSVSTEKTGRWIENNDDHYDWYECSECGYGSEGEITTENGVRFNYCPICGAKMGVEE